MSQDTLYQVNPKELETSEPFSTLFPMNKATVAAITESIKTKGYDTAEPLVVWHGVVIDGHTRLLAAKRANLSRVPCVYRDFKDEDDALKYAFHRQRDRRNITDADLVRVLRMMDERKKSGERTDLAQPCARLSDTPSDHTPPKEKKSAFKTASILGISPRKVEQIRTVIDKAAPEVMAAVESGEMKINAAYNETVKPKPVEVKGGGDEPRSFRFKCSIAAEVEAETEEGAVMAFLELMNSYSEARLTRETKVVRAA